LGALDLARAAEQHGFESLFLADHSHVPVKRETPFAGEGGGDLPPEYYRIGDLLVTLAAVSSVTTTLKLGMGACLVTQRDPIILAKEVATLDELSGGRVIFGVAVGWSREEMRNHGTDPKTRTRLLRERCEAMKEIWTKEQAEYHGDFVDFDPLFSWPKPVQDPHPPILVASWGPTVLDRVLAFGNGWMTGPPDDLGALRANIDELTARATAEGAGPRTVTVAAARIEDIEKYAEMGVERAIFQLPDGTGTEMLSSLAQYAKAAGLMA
jgi:probable F420-dependent oxidoreductase